MFDRIQVVDSTIRNFADDLEAIKLSTGRHLKGECAQECSLEIQ